MQQAVGRDFAHVVSGVALEEVCFFKTIAQVSIELLTGV
jgi:hypothetical protein